ncbi:MAG: hypothetical protein WBW28_11995, partial [Pseudolabrys sp.]
MSKEKDNKAIVGRWFTDFWGKTSKLDIVDELAAPDMLPEGLDLPLDIRGTAFQRRVWRALKDIPVGRTIS